MFEIRDIEEEEEKSEGGDATMVLHQGKVDNPYRRKNVKNQDVLLM
jgi:hypothetical protein